MDKAPFKPWSPNAHHYWQNLSYGCKIQDLINNYLPFHINFLQGWLAASNSQNIKWITYEDFIKDEIGYLKRIFLDFKFTFPDIDLKLTKKEQNFNKGKIGRGNEKIPEEYKKQIK